MKKIKIDNLELGIDPKRRHSYWDVGKGIGLVCRKCGQPKPRADQLTHPCYGTAYALRTPQELQTRREQAIPNLLFGWAWARMVRESGIEMNPNYVYASNVAARAPFAPLGETNYHAQLQQAADDSKEIYQSVPSDTDPRTHCLAVAILIMKLANGDMLPDPTDQACVMAVAHLDEARDQGSDWSAPRDGELGQLADRMMKCARDMGYYQGRIASYAVTI